MEDGATCKRIMSVQVNKYNENRPHCTVNECNSPMWDILNVAQRLNLLDNCLNMIMNGHKYPKKDPEQNILGKGVGLRRRRSPNCKRSTPQREIIVTRTRQVVLSYMVGNDRYLKSQY